jgi:hypothetical protein
MASARDPGGATAVAVVPWELYNPFAKEVLTAGYVLAVGDGGEAAIQAAGSVDFPAEGREIDNEGLGCTKRSWRWGGGTGDSADAPSRRSQTRTQTNTNPLTHMTQKPMLRVEVGAVSCSRCAYAAHKRHAREPTKAKPHQNLRL